MSAAFELRRLGRSVGIVAVFSILGPLVVAAVLTLVVLAVGIPFLQIMLLAADLDALRPWLSIGVFLLLMFGILAAIPPAFVTGLAFAIAAAYFRANALWVALLVAALAAFGIVAMGFVVSGSSNDTLVLIPSVTGLRQALFLSLFLAIPAAIAASLCWLATRPLHRSP